MLTLIIPGQEFFNEETQEFIMMDEVVLELEHSLASLSKWESKYRKPFLSSEIKTDEEVIGYIEAMVVSGPFSFDVYKRMSQSQLDEINEYISSPESATTFSDYSQKRGSGRSEVITSELIYYWMTTYNIPFECQYWHLNRLFALLRIANIKNSKEKKIPRSAAAAQQRNLNAQRRAQLGTSG